MPFYFFFFFSVYLPVKYYFIPARLCDKLVFQRFSSSLGLATIDYNVMGYLLDTRVGTDLSIRDETRNAISWDPGRRNRFVMAILVGFPIGSPSRIFSTVFTTIITDCDNRRGYNF